MVPVFRLRDLDRSKITPQSREQSLARLQRWKDADEALKRVCAEKGIPVPILVC
ncbi:hypothetical protein D3C71_1053860 [compost metagenome]|jgi:hypothetical protein